MLFGLAVPIPTFPPPVAKVAPPAKVDVAVVLVARYAAAVGVDPTRYKVTSFVLSAVGPSGIAFLGDRDQFVTLGKKRIPSFTDTGRVDATVAYGAGEQVRTLFGYATQPVAAVALDGSVEHGRLWRCRGNYCFEVPPP